MEATRLVVKSFGKAPEGVYLAGTTVKIGQKEGTSSDLKAGNTVRVASGESDGKLVAKTVVAKTAKTRT